MIIAVDGPVAAGKGTLARRLAAHFGFAYLDTGGLYRAVALSLLDAGHAPEDEAAWVAALARLDADRGLAQRLGTSARRDFLERYTWAGRAERIVQYATAALERH